MSDHDAWLVDLDGTLYDARLVKVAMAAELFVLGWRALGTLRHFRHEHEQIRADGEEADSPFQLQIERTAHALGVGAEYVERTVQHWMIERPGKWLKLFRRKALLQEIAEYRQAGGKTALVSDYPARAKLRALGHTHLFDQVVASGEPGGPRRLKPHPEGYLLAAERLGVEPSRCLVLGDRVDADGAAARAAGMAFRRIQS